MMARQGLLRELLGPLYPYKSDDEEEDCAQEEEEGDQDSEFVDAEELCSGGIKAGSLPGRMRVSIPDENTKEKCTVYGRFPLKGPWWRVKVQVVRPARSKSYQVQGFPSYFLRADMSPPGQKQICSLFLKECGLAPERIQEFLKWVDGVSGFENLNFGNLRETLRSFYSELEKKDKKPSTQNGQNAELKLEKSFPFISAMTALQFPKVMEFLPTLLPRHFKRLLSSCSEWVLGRIEETLDTQPWKLGFRRITYAELRLLRCEASWKAFSQCPSLLGLMTPLQKNALVLYSKLRETCREDGHTYVEVKDLTSGLSDHMSFEEACESLAFLRDIEVVTYEKDCVFLYELYEAEQDIASSICELMNRPPWRLKVDVKNVLASISRAKHDGPGSAGPVGGSKPEDVGSEQGDSVLDAQDHARSNGEHIENAETNDVPLDRDQVVALETICNNAVTVLSGKGGCGKTTIVSHLFKHVEQLEEREVQQACEDFELDQEASEEWLAFPKQSPAGVDKAIEVLLTAPTGKAAGLLRQKTHLPAYTLCQVNYSFYMWKKNKVDKPWKFSTVRVLVVDEGSLVSVGIFKSVLKLLCEHSKLSKLVILGDIRQLPSIEPGNMLQDVFETLKSRQCAIELKTNHRTESQLIVDNAGRISRRQFPEFDAELNISENPTLPLSIQDKTFIFVRLPEEDSSSQSSKGDHRSNLYSAVKTLLQGKDFCSFECAKTSQFIAFRRQDCDLINDCCCKHYTSHLIKDHEKKLIFTVGDKICCTRNAYLADLLPDNDQEAMGKGFGDATDDDAKIKQDLENSIRLCNGEIFFITQDVTDVTFGRKRLVTINNEAGLEVTVDFSKLMANCQIKHAWARTIHTFQGSEENTVAYVVGKAGRQHWQHVYTAVTRGRSRVYIIAQESELRSAIRKRSFPRQTRLKHFLQKQLSSSCAPSAGLRSQPSSPSAGRRPGTQPPASPLCRTPDNKVIANSARAEASPAAKESFAFDEGWMSSSFNDDMDTDDESAQLRGSKRTGVGFPFDEESPSKFRMVEKPSPQVSSIFQNLRLNNLTPRQLFKPTDNQETGKSGVADPSRDPRNQETEP